MPNTRLRIMLGLLLLVAASGICADTDVLETRLRLLAGKGAVDCGDVQVREDPTAASQCAKNALLAKKVFIVRYWLQGIDSRVGVGLAGTKAARVFAVEYDSMGWNSDGLRKGAKLLDENHNIVEQCPAPVQLRDTTSHRVTCFPPDPKAKGNIMSPNAEPY